NIAVLISGVSIAVSIFLLIVTFATKRRIRAKILSYIGGVFVVVLISNVVYVLQTFSLFPGTGHQVEFFLAVELIILLLFYAGIARGIG
ncbi:MAG TPA: hypothetical protein VJ944_01995, partial [Thermoplasmataceae archaeon]|nr:hypothetical protein [Thermoplasmataceae archaeon]